MLSLAQSRGFGDIMKNFILVGRTGVGKSSFINAAFGAKLAETDPYEACTVLPKYYAYGTEYGDICLLDTPGLGEDDVKTDKKYLKRIQKELRHTSLDAVLLVCRLDEKRFCAQDKHSLLLLSERLTSLPWENTWLVFTFCSRVPYHKVDTSAEIRKGQIEEYLMNHNPQFYGFERIILMDNCVPDWAPDAKPITSILV